MTTTTVLEDIMDAVAARLSTIAGLRVYAFPPDTLQAPAAFVNFPDSIDYDKTFRRGADTYDVRVLVFVARVSDRNAKTAMAAYLDAGSARSLKAVLEADDTLGGTAQTVRVQRAQNIGIRTFNEIEYLSAEWVMSVIA